jgi:hypothetical protein
VVHHILMVWWIAGVLYSCGWEIIFWKQRNHNKPPDFRILFLILNPKYVHVFKSAILFSILNPT